MLKARVCTALFLIPLVVLAVLQLPPFYFGVISAGVFLMGMWEWTALSGIQSIPKRIGGLLLMPLFLLGVLAVLQACKLNWLGGTHFVLLLIFWSGALWLLTQYPRGTLYLKKPMISLMIGAFVLIPAWAFLCTLQNKTPKLALFILVLVWTADSAAYFAGKRFGKHKLLASVSPGKTWEGVGGALAASTLLLCVAYPYLPVSHSWLSWLVMGWMTVLFSIVGDLFESLFKRLHHLKDSGTFLPGHGGILDRIDALTAAVPIFTLGICCFN